MKSISILLTQDPDEWVMEDIEDAINVAMYNHFNKWDYTITIQDVTE